MNVEIVEFYPLSRNETKGELTGTLRVRLPELGLHILGVYVSKRGDAWYFTLPGREAVSHKTGERIRYPFIVFEDREKQKELVAAIREQGRAFIERRLTETENPIVFPELSKKPPGQDRKPEIKAPTPGGSKPPAKQVFREYSDLPPCAAAKRGARL
jgi:hypothetical protein